ncbi:MAG: hypothetical protein KDC84_05330 [Crocinitomicaceae bacterium]|nr:hypothetical protein [Crocinitomicaceae bacterium]
MKYFKSLLALYALVLVFSCETDPMVVFPGTWKVNSGGTITFNENGTGYSINSTSFWLADGCLTGDTIPFLWETTPLGKTSKGTIRLEYLEADGVTLCGASSSITYKIKSKDEIQLGEQVLGVGIIDILIRQ